MIVRLPVAVEVYLLQVAGVADQRGALLAVWQAVLVAVEDAVAVRIGLSWVRLPGALLAVEVPVSHAIGNAIPISVRFVGIRLVAGDHPIPVHVFQHVRETLQVAVGDKGRRTKSKRNRSQKKVHYQVTHNDTAPMWLSASYQAWLESW